MKRSIIIGDVHGCLHELERLVERVRYHPEKDSLYFLGDIINRGPFSKECFFKVLNLKGVSIKGNHEWHAVQYARLNKETPVFSRLRKEFGTDYPDFLSTIADWPVYIETDDFILVHGGLVPGIPLEESDDYLLTSIRTWDGIGRDIKNPDNPPWFDFYMGSKLVVFGHWARLGGLKRKNVIGLDTGCVYGRELSALLLPERRIVSVPAEKAYAGV